MQLQELKASKGRCLGSGKAGACVVPLPGDWLLAGPSPEQTPGLSETKQRGFLYWAGPLCCRHCCCSSSTSLGTVPGTGTSSGGEGAIISGLRSVGECVTRPAPCQGLLAGQLHGEGMLCTDPLARPHWLWEEGKAARGGPSAPYNDQEPCGGRGRGVCSQWGCGTDRIRPEARKEKGGSCRLSLHPG